MSPPFPTPAAASRPAALRGYATLVIALAAFLASMVALRVPFRGYLIQSRLSGRLGDGLSASDVQTWLKQAAPEVHVRVETQPGGQCAVALEQLTLRAGEAQIAMDRVARQFAEQFVAERREAARQVKLARLQAELQSARDTEDALRVRADELRQQQVAAAPQPPEPVQPAAPQAPQPTFEQAVAREAYLQGLRLRLELLRIELARLLASFTEQHPQVITIRSQMARLEDELSDSSGNSSARRPDRQAAVPKQPAGFGWISATQYSEQDRPDSVESAVADLAAATRTRQWTERQLQIEVERLSGTAGFPWSIESARVLARVGGTPRALTLAAAGLVSLLAAGLMFWASAALVPRPAICTTEQLRALLELPLAGQAVVAPPRRAHRRLRLAGPLAVTGAVRAAEILLAAMILALVFTMVSDRWLASQVLVDPFGVLSEVAGRLMG
jgi:hypothetical protein